MCGNLLMGIYEAGVNFGDVDEYGRNYNKENNFLVKSCYIVIAKHIAEKVLEDHEEISDLHRLSWMMSIFSLGVFFLLDGLSHLGWWMCVCLLPRWWWNLL